MSEPVTILLVEDDPFDTELTLAMFAANHLEEKIAHVRDGEAALDYLYRRRHFAERTPGNPVVILLDLRMPKLTGLEVLQRIKADAGLKSIPVIALTSSRQSPDVKRCYEHGATAFVVKPVRFEDFATTVKRLGIFGRILNQPPPDPGNGAGQHHTD